MPRLGFASPEIWRKKKTSSLNERPVRTWKYGRLARKWKDPLPHIHFQVWAVSFREGNPPKRRFPKKLIECQLDSHSRKVPQKEKVTAWHFSWNKDKQKANPPVWYFLETLEPRLQPIVLECVSTIFTCLRPLSTFKVAPLRPNIQTTNYYRSFHQTGRIFPAFTLHLSLFFTRFFWQMFQAPPILDDLWNPRSWSVDPSTGTPRTTSVKKKKRRKMSTEESFFFESWSLKMRGFFYHLFPLTKILMCEEKNGFLQNSLETYESFDFFSRRKSGKLRTRHLACPRWLPRGVDPTSTALHWARQRLHEISGFFVGCPRPKPGFKKSKEWSKVTSLQKGSESW